MLLKVAAFCCCFALLHCHPQCLDYRPPFKTDTPLLLCSQYQNFTCCLNDNELKVEYDKVIAKLTPADRNSCSPFIRDVMCQRCSPYAAHAYNAEGNRIKRVFPKLCTNYFGEMLASCGHLDVPVLRDVLRPSQSPYCYPNILDGVGNIGELNMDEEKGGCITVCVEEVVTYLHSTTSAKHAGDGSHRFFVSEQRGVIRAFDENFKRIPGLFLDIRNQVDTHAQLYDERGLLDFDFHPDFKNNGKFYVYFTTLDHRRALVSRLSEFQVSERDGNRADRNSERVLLDIEQTMNNHNGGSVFFHEGLLYLFTGDGGHQGDPHNYAQSLTSLLGKAIRIDVNSRDGDLPYAIPRDNPFYERGTRDENIRREIFAYGFRNPWRCSVDRGDPVTHEGRGRIFCGDVGQDDREEVDLVVKGANYGWNGFEGTRCFDREKCERIKDHTPPIYEYGHDVGLSVIGGVVYRGCQSPNLQGHYIYGDWNSNVLSRNARGSLFSLRQDDGERWYNTPVCMGGYDVCTSDRRGKGMVNTQKKFLTSFAQDESGEIYLIQTQVSSVLAQAASIYKLVDPARRGFTCSIAEKPITLGGSSSSGEIELRLVSDFSLSFVGRVEVRRGADDRWGVLCASSGWNKSAANVVCRSLGFARSYAHYRSNIFGVIDLARTPVRARAPSCGGGEKSLADCEGFEWGLTEDPTAPCTSFNYASVMCV